MVLAGISDTSWRQQFWTFLTFSMDCLKLWPATTVQIYHICLCTWTIDGIPHITFPYWHLVIREVHKLYNVQYSYTNNWSGTLVLLLESVMYTPTYMYISVQYYTGCLLHIWWIQRTRFNWARLWIIYSCNSSRLLSWLSAFSTISSNVSMNSWLSRAFPGASLRLILSTLSWNSCLDPLSLKWNSIWNRIPGLDQAFLD